MTRWITQTRFASREDDRSGNCMEAAVASLLGVDLETIGCFRGGDERFDLPEEKVVEYWERFEAAFSSRGFHVMRLPGDFAPDVLYLASGPARRGFHHMVVMSGGKLIHDPHPDGSGLERVDCVWLCVPHDPAMVPV